MTTTSNCAGVVFVACLVTFLILAGCLTCGYQKWKNKTTTTMDRLTKESFVVQNNKHEPEWVREEVARRLAEIVRKVDILVAHMRSQRLPDSVVSERLYQRWQKIRTNPKGLRETSPGENSAAYTINKGEQMRICVRDERSDNLFEDENDSMFVILHELGHLMSKSYGHNMEFKKNFSYVTKIAVELELYKYTNYMEKPTTYCNVDITHTAY
jgi:Zn-dependent protease with chaperone function